eukprot:TRINITY_DN2223_c0_g1_i1.p1 TRINITY_DN2223_c0_g1~~TRINITY_DN2223_c0_g1_i1.p1  ORF type:complete len:267 (-),score=40.37 TRINITY_DN2223_c0_g1_i1:103-903(-)
MSSGEHGTEQIRVGLERVSKKLSITLEVLYKHLPHLAPSCSEPYTYQVNKDKALSSYIDHTTLSPLATESLVDKLLNEAQLHKFAAVCVNPSRAEQAVKKLKGTEIKVASVVGFPLGATTTNTKVAETLDLVKIGVDEIDMVVNIGKLKDGDYQYVLNDIKSVVDNSNGVVIKVILETGALTTQEIIDGCILSVLAGASFVKTSTGTGQGIATKESVELMRAVVGSSAEVKASSGIKTYSDAMLMIRSGATRIGTSSGIAIIEGKP